MRQRQIPGLLSIKNKTLEERNAVYLVIEIFWASMLASAATFIAPFALRLGATNAQIGLLSSIPALMAVLVSIPAGRFLNKKHTRKNWLIASLFLYRASFLIVAFIPLLNLPLKLKGFLVILTIVLFSSLAHFFNVGFIPLLSETVPESKRASVFSARNIVFNLSMSICVFLFGIWLEKSDFPTNYQILYVFGFLCSLLSIYYLMKVNVPDAPIHREETKSVVKNHPKLLWESFQRHYQQNPGFSRIVINTFLHGLGVWAAAPLYVLHYVRNLGANEAWLGLNSTISTATTILGFAIWRWIIRRLEEPTTLKLTIMWVGFYPLLIGLWWFVPELQSLKPILILTGINGLIIPGVNLSHFNMLLKVTPDNNRPGFTAAYITVANLGAFICPFLGVYLSQHIGLAITLIGCGIACIIGSASFWIWPIKAKITTNESGG